MGWTHYDDVGEVYELSAVFDDTLKKDDDFITYAVKVANRILEDKGVNALATWGKWGARIEPSVNAHLSHRQIDEIANIIFKHESWIALTDSTNVFTYGKQDEEVVDFQAELTQKIDKEI